MPAERPCCEDISDLRRYRRALPRQARGCSDLTWWGLCSISSEERMAPRVGFEPTTNRLTADCSTTELPRNTFVDLLAKARSMYRTWHALPSPNCHRCE